MAGGYKSPKSETVSHSSKVAHGIAHLVDSQGSTNIKGDRGVEVDAFGGSDIGKGLKVHSLHSRPELTSHDGANETLQDSGN